jgi:SNF2 family DNA or RNA helicase
MEEVINRLLKEEVSQVTRIKAKRISKGISVKPLFKHYDSSSTLHFKVKSESSKMLTYDVTFSFETLSTHGPECTCPQHSVETYCKHIAGCLLYLLDHPKLHSKPNASQAKVPINKTEVIQRSSSNYMSYHEILSETSQKLRYELEYNQNLKSFEILLHQPEENKVVFSIDNNTVTFIIYKSYFTAQCTCDHKKTGFCVHSRAILLQNYFRYRDPFYIRKFRDLTQEKNIILEEMGFKPDSDLVNEIFDFYLEHDQLKIREKKNVILDFEKSAFTKRIKSLKKGKFEVLLPKLAKDIPDGHILILNTSENHPTIGIHPYIGSLPDPQKVKAKIAIKSKHDLTEKFPEFSNLVFAFTNAGIIEALREYNLLSSWYRNDNDELKYNMNSDKWETVYASMISTAEKNLTWLTESNQFYTLKDFSLKLHPTNLQPLNFSKTRAKAHLKIEKKEHFLEITPKIILEDETYDLSDFTSVKNLFFIKDEEVYLINRTEEKGLLDDFQDTQNIKIPNGKIHEFIKDFILPIRKNFSVDIPDDLVPEKIQPILTQKAVRLKEVEPNFLIIEPFMIYDGDQTSIYDDEAFTVKEGKTAIIDRDLEEEAAFDLFLQNLHPDFAEQKNYSYFYLSVPKVIQKQWFFDFFKKLNEKDVQVFGHKELKKLNFNPNRPKLNITGSSGIDWFDLKIELSYGDEVVPLKILKTALVNKQDYVVLSDGSFGMLPEEWIKKFTPILKIGNTEKNKLRMSKLHFGLLDTADEYLTDKKIREELQEKKSRLSGIDKTAEIALPKNIQATLRPYQEAGFQWFNKLHQLGWGGCLADDMGLGKTLQSLSFIRHIHNQNPKAKILIICPTSLIYNWMAESQKFTPDLRILTYHGVQRELDEQYDLLITSYGTFRNDLNKLKEIEFEVCILDESQAIKNPIAAISKAVGQVNAKSRFVLSGTPLQNNTFDLYSQFNFINPGLLGSQEYFKEEFANPIDKQADSEKSQLLRKMIYPFMLRRTKEQVATDLPDKTESIIFCEMESYQRKVYDALKIDYRDKILGKIETEGLEKTAFLILEGLNRLRMACDCPSLIKDEEAKRFKSDSVKLKELVRELDENSGQHKVLIFSQFLGMLDLIKEQLNKKGIKHLYLDGSTPAKDRQGLVDTFQTDPSIKTFLISLKAGGVGLNLTAADYVYIVDPWWNPAVEDQAIDRTHRIGQTNKVFAYKLICKDSIEEKIHQLQQKKKALAKEIVAEEASFIKKLTKDDVAWLLE